ncbi:hypothetical protein [Halomonas sp. WWR20]
MSDTRLFRSLRIYNYRVWAAGALVSNVGTWMQSVAQDWLVLTILTDHNATGWGWARPRTSFLMPHVPSSAPLHTGQLGTLVANQIDETP